MCSGHTHVAYMCIFTDKSCECLIHYSSRNLVILSNRQVVIINRHLQRQPLGSLTHIHTLLVSEDLSNSQSLAKTRVMHSAKEPQNKAIHSVKANTNAYHKSRVISQKCCAPEIHTIYCQVNLVTCHVGTINNVI